MKKFPSIVHFRQLVNHIRLQHTYRGKDEEGNPIYQYDEDNPYPILDFIGTVKLHGTNSAVVKYASGEIQFQARGRVLSLSEDNDNFMEEMLKKSLDFLFTPFSFKDYIAIYGEWCGEGIQKGTAISKLPKMFVIFGIKIDDEWVEIPKNLFSVEDRIYNVFQFTTYPIRIDFNNPELVQKEIETLTLAVEDHCPVGAYFGVDGLGEGIVFASVTDLRLKFKVKGKKHSVSKEKIICSVTPEELASIAEFVEFSVTENRLTQALSVLKEKKLALEVSSLGEFLRWIVLDILREEQDTILQNELDEKKIKKAIVEKAKNWFFDSIVNTWSN